MSVIIENKTIGTPNFNVVTNGSKLECGSALLTAKRPIEKKIIKWVALGDSITDLKGRPNNYPYWIAQRNPKVKLLYPNGMADHGDFGVGGSTISFDRGDDIKDFFTRAKQIPDDVDMITVFGGVNDWNWSVALGTFTTEYDSVVRPKNQSTFYKGLYRLVYYLKNRFPNKPILFFTPMYAVQESFSNDKNGDGKTIFEYGNAMKEVCAYFSIPCFDLAKNAGLSFKFSTYRKNYCLDSAGNDSGSKFHPNAAGSNIISHVMEREIIRVYEQFGGKWHDK